MLKKISEQIDIHHVGKRGYSQRTGKASSANENGEIGEESFRLLFGEDCPGNASSVQKMKDYNERAEDIQSGLKRRI